MKTYQRHGHFTWMKSKKVDERKKSLIWLKFEIHHFPQVLNEFECYREGDGDGDKVSVFNYNLPFWCVSLFHFISNENENELGFAISISIATKWFRAIFNRQSLFIRTIFIYVKSWDCFCTRGFIMNIWFSNRMFASWIGRNSMGNFKCHYANKTKISFSFFVEWKNLYNQFDLEWFAIVQFYTPSLLLFSWMINLLRLLILVWFLTSQEMLEMFIHF